MTFHKDMFLKKSLLTLNKEAMIGYSSDSSIVQLEQAVSLMELKKCGQNVT